MGNINYDSRPFNSMRNINYYLRIFNAITYSFKWEHKRIKITNEFEPSFE